MLAESLFSAASPNENAPDTAATQGNQNVANDPLAPIRALSAEELIALFT